MTDEELAVNWIRSQGWSEETLPSDKFGQTLQAFLAGLKAGRQEKWHDLRKNPKDLPAENQEVLVYFTLPDKSKNAVTLAEFENNDFNFVDLQDVIAWREIVPPKELEK